MSSSTVAGTVGLVVEGALARIILDQPARHNAMSLAMWRQVPQRVADAVADASVRAIQVEGAGESAFSSGADISEFARNRDGPEAGAAYDDAVHAALDALREAEKPTLAAIRGICFGGGVEIALCCDLRIAAVGARFRVPAARLGIGYSYEGVALLADRVGEAAAAEILFTAAIIEARDAERLGLVQRVFPRETFVTETRALASSITANAPLVLRSLKRALVEHAKPAGQRNLAEVRDAVAACLASDDYREGRAAFQEKREPRFGGR